MLLVFFLNFMYSSYIVALEMIKTFWTMVFLIKLDQLGNNF